MLEEEQLLLDLLPDMPDLQAAWVLLLYCAAPRANHLLRLLPPNQSIEYARQHDDLMRTCLGNLLQQPRPLGRQSPAWRLASLPLRLGGAGLRSAERTAPGAYWAAWADALAVLRERQPAWAQRLCEELQAENSSAGCLREAQAAGRVLDEEGWQERPSWASLLQGQRPQRATAESPEEIAVEPGEWQHGWQFSACSVRETRYREHELLPRLSADQRAMLRSGSGPGAVAMQ